jgi:putative spermidine/putrescine transport system ATP-binding protein
VSAAVEFDNVSRHFGEIKAVDQVDFRIEEGTFFAMLGPSGSGKTTCLRLIAGFDRPTDGHISIFGEHSELIPPNRRNVNTVFQDYALFPHMNVRDNVAYGLMIKGVAKFERLNKAEEMLALVKLPGLGERTPAQLSGGQRQRVALARALLNQPRVLLLDEPLGALDLKLREEMQDELKALQQNLGITFVFVTHDQGEALSMADDVAVFDHGKVMQIGSPEEIYRRPANAFVANFVGSSNVLQPEFTRQFLGLDNWASLRPEAIRLTSPAGAVLRGSIVSVRYLGASRRVSVQVGESRIAAVVSGSAPLPQPGETVGLQWSAEELHLMDDE